MEKMITNCTDCPMARQNDYRYSTSFVCNASDAIMVVYANEHREDDELPAPEDCPLRNESIVITLKQ